MDYTLGTSAGQQRALRIRPELLLGSGDASLWGKKKVVSILLIKSFNRNFLYISQVTSKLSSSYLHMIFDSVSKWQQETREKQPPALVYKRLLNYKIPTCGIKAKEASSLPIKSIPFFFYRYQHGNTCILSPVEV